MDDSIVFIVFIAFISFLVFILVAKYFMTNNNSKDNFMSGYGFDNYARVKTIFIPLNEVSKSTDFKLFSLVTQLKYSINKPLSVLFKTGTKNGIVDKTPSEYSNIILFPGLADCIIRQNSKQIWPPGNGTPSTSTPSTNTISTTSKSTTSKSTTNKSTTNKSTPSTTSTSIYNNNKGHFNTITTLLEALGYKENSKLHTMVFDYRDFDINNIINEFKSNLTNNTVIIGYDFGCTIANLCIQSLSQIDKKMISKFLLICPTIGGVPLAIRDYMSGNGIIDPVSIYNNSSVLMSLPNENMYDKPIVIYNSVSYNSEHIPYLLKELKISHSKYLQLKQLQNLSLKNPGVKCIIVANNQFNTPISYNYKNNLRGKPETYLPENNTEAPSRIPEQIFEGLQAKGDSIVPIQSIINLKNMWGDNCVVELIKDKDHFTILKSYELGLIITSIL